MTSIKTRTASAHLEERLTDYAVALDTLPEFDVIERRVDVVLGRISDEHWVLLALDAAPESLSWVCPSLPERGSGWSCSFEDIGCVSVTHFLRH